MSSGYEKWYYPATQENIRTLGTESDNLVFGGFVEKPLAIIDLPFSLVFDTLLWPIDYVDGNYGRPQVRPKNKIMPPQKPEVIDQEGKNEGSGK